MTAFRELTEEDLKFLHTLEAAAIRVQQARDGKGLRVHLCNPMDATSVRDALTRLCGRFWPGYVFTDGPEGPEAALTNIGLLAALLKEHVKEKTYTCHTGNPP